MPTHLFQTAQYCRPVRHASANVRINTPHFCALQKVLIITFVCTTTRSISLAVDVSSHARYLPCHAFSVSTTLVQQRSFNKSPFNCQVQHVTNHVSQHDTSQNSFTIRQTLHLSRWLRPLLTSLSSFHPPD
eukprot:gb/GEZJ01009635.1/.p1 GENE.gb/GEZJ01009635.1/~~gb/GEZJ01009635.1/.p1  ORF type:complete len:131 (-),score=8.04 gb/GEZJ01009635.1/:291-683(-)